MTCRIPNMLRRFCRDEAGSVETISFAIWMPLILMTLMLATEIGVYSARATMLEKGLDLVIRDIRLGTGTAPQHDEIKNRICEHAAILPNCEQNLRLEMVQRDPRSWTGLPTAVDCIDNSQEVSPVRSFTSGQSNELMVLRACAKVSPIFPMTWWVQALQKDGAGDIALVTSSAFVQEPR